MNLSSRIILPALAVVLCASVAGADVKKRWELDFKHDRPEHYTFTSPLGNASNFWYITYTVTNNTPQACPQYVDIALRVDTRNYQQPGFYPVEEAAIIAHADGLEGYSVGIQKEIIEDFKKRRKYLTKSDLRAIKVLQPGESIHCLAMFEDKQYRYNDVEVLVSGLVDPVTYKVAKEAGDYTSKSPIHLRYENRVFRLTYTREGDQFRSFQRGLTLQKHDWIVVGVNPAVTKEDVAELTAALTNKDELVRRIALQLLVRYTTAARKDIDLLGEDVEAYKKDPLKAAKEAIAALGGIQGLKAKSPALFSSMEAALVERIPPIDQELLDLKLDGGELNSDQIKALADKLKVVIVKAQENKCPTPGTSVAVLTRETPSSQNIYDWVCGYKDPSTGILYHGIQQWKEFITDVMSADQQGGFNFVESLFESLNSDDPTVRDVAISVLKDIVTDDRMVFDVKAFDTAKSLDEQDAAVKDGVRRWHEWWSRHRDSCYWNPNTNSFEPLKRK